MPYHDKAKPYVNFWFSATNASSPKYFRQNFSVPRIDKLVRDGGLCIAYIHFGTKFYRAGQLDNYFTSMLEYVAGQDGWFAPVSEILDFLRQDDKPERRAISKFDLQKLELSWFFDKVGKKTGI